MALALTRTLALTLTLTLALALAPALALTLALTLALALTLGKARRASLQVCYVALGTTRVVCSTAPAQSLVTGHG